MNVLEASVVSGNGISGIAIIQIRCHDAAPLLSKHLRKLRSDDPPTIKPQSATLARWMDGEDSVDEVLVIQSHIGGCLTVTINCHGNVKIVERIMDCLHRDGAEIIPDMPPERLFTCANRIESSVMRHLQSCQTPAVALWLTRQIEALPTAIQDCISYIKQGQLTTATRLLTALRKTRPQSETLLGGLGVALLGPPNAGKSTLANCLFERPISTVSHQPGTTRDWIDESAAWHGVPVTIVDTAGIRRTSDTLEHEAIQQSINKIRTASVRLLVVDGSKPIPAESTWSQTADHNLQIGVFNKSDLADFSTETHDKLFGKMGIPKERQLSISAAKRVGIERLKDCILSAADVAPDQWPSPAVWEDEHIQLIDQALSELGNQTDNPSGHTPIRFLSQMLGI